MNQIKQKNSETSPPLQDIPSTDKMPNKVEKPKFWENPTFLFVCMGFLTMASMLGTYFIAQKYDDPMIVIGAVSLVAGITTLVGGMTIKTIDELSTANRMKTEFVSIASHQLRTPLSIIKWYVEFLEKPEKNKNMTAEQLGYVKTIDQSNQRMIKLVNDLLDISRVESGRMQVKPQQINLVELVKNTIEDNKPLALSKKINISFKYEEEIPLLFVDPKRMGIAIENLLSNSIKYISKPDNGQITVDLYKQGDKIILSVGDNGVGIPKRDQKKIFKKFFRADNTMKLKTSGTGLGLFISKAIIESHKGKMWFVSKEGEGTTFYINLPVKKKVIKRKK